MTYWRLSTLFVLALLCANCTHTKSILFRSKSPDGSKELQLVASSRFPPESGSFVQAVLVTAQGTRVLQEWYRNDLGFSFATVVWDGQSTAGIMWADIYHGTEIAAYDVRRGTAINSAGLVSVLGDQVRREYMLSKNVSDPIAWAKTVEGQNAFSRAHPR